MAIYPYTNTYVINKEAVAGSQFKAGMVLIMNSEGKAIPADSQSLVLDTIGQKQSKILGLAAGDANLAGNTIIVQDTAGNNYLDENKNFVNASNAEYLSIRRQLLDNADETVNEYYNMNFSPIPKRRGIGVYSLNGDIFATDQFKAVLHGDYGIDSTDTISFSPGDLLTFGGGVNAGKLVKVNKNSFGPDVVVMGIVEKYNSNTGLLFFRQTNYVLSFIQTDIIYLDAAVSLSYPGSGLTMNDLSTSGYTYDIINGTSFVSAGSASYFNFDGADDRIRAASVLLYGLNITILAWVWRNGSQGDYTGIVFDRNPLVSGLNIAPSTGANLGYHWNGNYYNDNSLITIPNQSWALVSMAINATSATFGCNGTYNTLNNSHSSTTWNTMTIASDVSGGSTSRCWNGRIGQAIMLNKTMTNAEITAYYNLTKGRYGL
jgi:hypothetical protein